MDSIENKENKDNSNTQNQMGQQEQQSQNNKSRENGKQKYLWLSVWRKFSQPGRTSRAKQ